MHPEPGPEPHVWSQEALANSGPDAQGRIKALVFWSNQHGQHVPMLQNLLGVLVYLSICLSFAYLSIYLPLLSRQYIPIDKNIDSLHTQSYNLKGLFWKEPVQDLQRVL